jgi:hypothetical protein
VSGKEVSVKGGSVSGKERPGKGREDQCLEMESVSRKEGSLSGKGRKGQRASVSGKEGLVSVKGGPVSGKEGSM